METERILNPPGRLAIGEPGGIDSFYTLEDLYGARRYRSPLYCKIFSKGGRKAYLDALQYRYLSLLDYFFFEKESRRLYRELFLQELEDLIGELRLLKVPQGHLRGFLETKGNGGEPLYDKILSMIENTGREGREGIWRFPKGFLFKLVGGTGVVLLAFYIHFRFILQS